MNRTILPLLAGALLSASNVIAQTTDHEVALEEFILRESAKADFGDLLPTSRPTLSVFGEQAIVDVPRSVLVLTHELMDTAGIEDFSDLAKVGAGTQQINYYGVPGTPILRGARGGVFFNGIQRAYQRNEMPLSFGSLDAMDVVRGPAPAQFGPSQAGGYVNMIPKSPFFDRRRGALRVSATETGMVRGQLDQGGPFLWGGRPAAYRASLTGQAGDTYYDGIRNDFVSLYASLKVRLARDVSLFAGGEYFNYRSNENAGWNRVTQALIDRGEYVIGEPISIVSSSWGGVANRDLLDATDSSGRRLGTALVVPAAIVDDGVSRGFITTAQRDAMLDLSNAGERAQAYAGFTSAQLADVTQSTSGFQYTPAYFEAGGRAFTKRIEGSTVLSDSRDHADSQNLLTFAELEDTSSADTLRRLQFMLDVIETEKLSSYGYAINTEQVLFELKGTFERRFALLRGMKLHAGASARYTDAKVLQDYSVEPFSRRDITTTSVSANTTILSGPQRGPDGLNYWSPSLQGGANAHSQLWQFSAFGYAINQITERLTTTTSVLAAHAPYTTRYPAGVDRVPEGDLRREVVRGHRDYVSGSFSPVLALAEGVNLYATAQYGTAIDPHQGGAITGRDNFTRNQLLEAGAKTSLAGGRFFASASVYRWEQERFDGRTNAAEPLEGDGYELEWTWAATRGLTLIASFGEQQMRRGANLTPFRAMPLSEQEYALYGGVFNHAFGPAYFNPAEGRRPAANPDLDYPSFPEKQTKLLAVYRHENGLGLSGGAVWSSSAWHNFDHTIRLPSSVVWNGAVSYRGHAWSVELSCQNLTDEDYFLGFEPVFGANTLVTKAQGREARVTMTFEF